MKVKIKKGNNTDLDAFVAAAPAAANPDRAAVLANSVGFVNNALQSMFSGVDIKLNGISTNSNFFTNGYTSYIQNILNYGSDALHSKLALSGWETDTDLTVADAHQAAPDSGFKRRATYTAESKEWTLIGQ